MKPDESATRPKRAPRPQRPLGPFRRAVLRGLAILMPPLLTIVIFLWVWNTVANYLLVPLENGARSVMIELADIRTPDASSDPPALNGTVKIDDEAYQINARGIVRIDDTDYQLLSEDQKFVPWEVFDFVRRDVGRREMPRTADSVYRWYIDRKWLPRQFVVPVFLCLFVLVLYLLGKFLAAGVGRFFWSQFERIIHRLPLIRNVYSSVKQVTDFMFTDPDLEYTRVVAVEYPRKGIWTTAFVTGESFPDIRAAAKEPVLSVLIPTSPMPFTGFTVTIKKSEAIDLNITIDQAFQFIVSCGVVAPPQELADALALRDAERDQRKFALASSADDDD